MQMRLMAGRFLNSGDFPAEGFGVPRGVVVSESFARLYFHGGDAVGGRVQHGAPGNAWSTIVGIVADVRHSSLEKSPQPTLYEPSWFADALAVRTALPPETVIASVRHVMHDINPAVALSDITDDARPDHGGLCAQEVSDGAAGGVCGDRGLPGAGWVVWLVVVCGEAA